MDKPCIFFDLDDTIFQSRRKFLASDQAALGRAENVGAVGSDGKANAFLRTNQRALLDWLAASTLLIPTTCRGLAQFRRAVLPKFHHAILYCGGMILDSKGEPDSQWNQQIEASLARSADLLAEAEMRVRHGLAGRSDVLIRRIRHGDTCYYLHAKVRSGRCQEIESIAAELSADRFAAVLRVHQHDASLFVMPRGVDKRCAVSYLLDSMPRPDLTIGIGDARSDFGFMDLCDFAMMPTRSQLWEALASLVPRLVSSQVSSEVSSEGSP